jgi:hypothetical protein
MPRPPIKDLFEEGLRCGNVTLDGGNIAASRSSVAWEMNAVDSAGIAISPTMEQQAFER